VITDILNWWKELKWWWKIPAVILVVGGIAAVLVIKFGEHIDPPPGVTSTKEIKKVLDNQEQKEVQLQKEAATLERERTQQLEEDDAAKETLDACGDDIVCVDVVLAEARRKRRD
jgi:hypothetical protein